MMAQPDTLVLGCTHFPALAARSAPRCRAGCVVDSAATTAAAVRRRMGEAGCRRGAGSVTWLATDDAERFARVGRHLPRRAAAARRRGNRRSVARQSPGDVDADVYRNSACKPRPKAAMFQRQMRPGRQQAGSAGAAASSCHQLDLPTGRTARRSPIGAPRKRPRILKDTRRIPISRAISVSHLALAPACTITGIYGIPIEMRFGIRRMPDLS